MNLSTVFELLQTKSHSGLFYLFLGDWLFSDSPQFLDHLLVLPHVHLGADEDDRHVGAVVGQLRLPLLTHIVERSGVNHRKADDEDILQ